MPDNQKSAWRTDRAIKDAESNAARERQRDIRNTIITLMLAAAIIIGGYFAPTIYYAFSNAERGTITELTDSDNGDVSPHVFDEPVSLYPWNLYDIANTSPLGYTERAFLGDHNVPNFLITAMNAYGMDIELVQPGPDQTASEYVTEMLVDSFSYLNTSDEDAQGCYVIYALDVNSDGISDIRCAVDQNGLIFSLLFLSNPWVEQDTLDKDAGTGAGADGTPPADTTGGAGGAGTNAQQPENEAGAGGADNTTTGIDDTTDDPYALNLEGLEATASGEELSIWSYVHFIALSATENGQTRLGEAASMLDAGFTERYTTVPDADDTTSTGPDAQGNEPVADETTATMEDDKPYMPVATVFAIEDYALYIYDLPNGMRFILYYDPDISRCVGYNLQL